MTTPPPDDDPALTHDVLVLHAMIQAARTLYGDDALRRTWRRETAGLDPMDAVTPAMVTEAARTLHDARLARTLDNHPGNHHDDATEDVHLVLGVCGIPIQAHD